MEPSLTIELVPSSCWYVNVRSNVSRETWDRLRRETSTRFEHRCRICGGRGIRHAIEAHEIWEYREETREQVLMGLDGICPRCHEVKHIGRAISEGRQREALAWLCHVNQMTPLDGLNLIRSAFDVQQERSRVRWTLNLALLIERYQLRLDRNYREVC